MHITPFERDSIVHEGGCSQAAEVQVYQRGISFVTKGCLFEPDEERSRYFFGRIAR